jgi:hypothetical protein
VSTVERPIRLNQTYTLVAPAAFHYVGFFLGFGLDQPVRILTGG